MDPRPFLLAGRRVAGPDVRPIRAPWDDRVVARVAHASADDLDAAIAAAHAAAPLLAALSPARRAAILEAARDGVRARRDALVDAIVDEAGKPVAAARAEVDRCVDTLTDAAWAARAGHGELAPLDAAASGEGRVGLVARVPVGPVAAITPFNFPLNLVAHKLAPAIAAGCPVVLKPAPQTPSAALILGELLVDAGLPEGGLSVLPLDVEAAGALSTDPRVRMLSFTGSAAVGWALKARATRAKVALELGGNAGIYVAADADLDRAVERLAVGAFAYAGQSCISVQRVFVHRDVWGAFLPAFVAHVRRTVRAGDPRDPDVTVGPVLRTSDAERIVAWIDEAVAAGATVHVGGGREGRLVAPTVVTGVDPGLRLAAAEVFGPVVCLWPVDDDDEGLRRLDDTVYGLQAGVFTRDVRLVLRAWRELHVGGVIHDDASAFRVDLMPYGGTRESGEGREGPRHAILEYTEPRILVLRA